MDKVRWIKILRNKYVITSIAFFFWMLLFDGNNLLFQYKLSSDLHDLKREKQFYLSGIMSDKALLEGLRNDPATLEKFAREKYLMKRDNEEVFLIPAEKLKETKK